MRLTIAALGLVLTACYTSSEGISPPLDRIYFPVGLTTECDARAGAPAGCQANWLYVANSDFDLQYNAGSIQVLDLKHVRDLIPQPCQSTADCSSRDTPDKTWVCDNPCAGDLACDIPDTGRQFSFTCVTGDGPRTGEFCGALGSQTAAEQILAPGPCRAVNLQKPQDNGAPLVLNTVGIGAFAADVILTTDLSREKKRLLLPVRGEASLHWIDINEDGSMDCGQDPSSKTPTCDREHRVGTDVNENLRNVRMPSEPFGIATSDEGDAIAVTHQTGGGVSLFYQDPVFYEGREAKDTKLGWAAGPRLESVSPLSASQAVAIAAVPESAYIRKKRQAWLKSLNSPESANQKNDPDPYPPGFLVAFANSPQMELSRAYADEPSSPSRPFMQRAALIPLRANSIDTISRGIAFDDSRRRACDEASCSVLDSDDCKRCANESVGVYVSNRSPGSLFIGATIPGTLDSYSRDIPQFVDAMPLLIGASRVYVGKVLVGGKLETRVFVVCFDQRRIAIYDPKSNSIEDYINTGRGPHAMAFDYYAGDAAGAGAYALAYVGHFTDSYIGVVQLDQSKLRNYGKIVLSLSERVAPRASK